MTGMTEQQSELLAFIRSESEQGRTPSYREMRSALGLSSISSVHRIILALTERGQINRLRYRKRAIQIIPQVADLSRIPTADLWAEIGRRANSHGQTTEAIRALQGAAARMVPA